MRLKVKRGRLKAAHLWRRVVLLDGDVRRHRILAVVQASFHFFPLADRLVEPDPMEMGLALVTYQPDRVARECKRCRHDLRHTFITRLAERPEISEQTIMSLAEHASRSMLARYSHIRSQAR